MYVSTHSPAFIAPFITVFKPSVNSFEVPYFACSSWIRSISTIASPVSGDMSAVSKRDPVSVPSFCVIVDRIKWLQYWAWSPWTLLTQLPLRVLFLNVWPWTWRATSIYSFHVRGTGRSSRREKQHVSQFEWMHTCIHVATINTHQNDPIHLCGNT